MTASPSPRILSFLTWTLVGLSAVYWGTRLTESAPSLQASSPVAVRGAPVDAAAVTTLLAGAPAGAAEAAPVTRRFELVGVVAEGRRGVALLSIDGQPAKPFLVGATVYDRIKLQAVGQRSAELADANSGALVQRLQLPEPAPVQLPAGLKFVPIPKP